MIYCGSEPRVAESVSLENAVVPLISRDQVEGTVFLAPDPTWCGEGLLLGSAGSSGPRVSGPHTGDRSSQEPTPPRPTGGSVEIHQSFPQKGKWRRQPKEAWDGRNLRSASILFTPPVA